MDAPQTRLGTTGDGRPYLKPTRSELASFDTLHVSHSRGLLSQTIARPSPVTTVPPREVEG